VRGCLDWLATGVGEPSEVSAATAEYRQDEDVIGQFLNASVESTPRGEFSSVSLTSAHPM
jgi:phage/plasmid-associated DNA primase